MFFYLKCLFWNAGLKLLFLRCSRVPDNKFHKSLSLDFDAMSAMTSASLQRYLNFMSHRRSMAALMHEMRLIREKTKNKKIIKGGV